MKLPVHKSVPVRMISTSLTAVSMDPRNNKFIRTLTRKEIREHPADALRREHVLEAK